MNDAQPSLFKMPEMPNTENSSTNIFDNRNLVIIGLIVLLILAVLGINLLSVSGNILQSITNIFAPLVLNILSLFGYATGTILNKTADIAGDTTKLGVDIAEGTVHSIGDLLKNSSNPNIDNSTRKHLDDAINIANNPFRLPEPKKEERKEERKEEHKKENFSAISNSGFSASWDSPDENQLKHGYISTKDYDKSLTGQLYPAQSKIFSPILFEQNR